MILISEIKAPLGILFWFLEERVKHVDNWFKKNKGGTEWSLYLKEKPNPNNRGVIMLSGEKIASKIHDLLKTNTIIMLLCMFWSYFLLQDDIITSVS